MSYISLQLVLMTSNCTQKVKTKKQYIPWDDIAFRLITYIIYNVVIDDSTQWFEGTLNHHLP